MAAITIEKNKTGILTPTTDFVDTGWSISAGIATHFPCNPGRMINTSVQGLVIGHTYNVTYDVSNYISGSVNFTLGGTDGSAQNSNIIAFSEDILCADDTGISFYSDGFLSVSNLVIYDVDQGNTALTFAYNEKQKLWTETQSFVPDMMLKYSDDFFSFQNGALWKHNSNPLAGNFYGVQYPSQITFFINSEPGSVKIPSGIIFESNKPWWVPNILVKPYTGKSLGMQSRIKIGKVQVLQGVFYADFLRNLLDPRFETQLQALLYGEELRGRVFEITIENDSTDQAILYKVQIKYTKQMLTP